LTREVAYGRGAGLKGIEGATVTAATGYEADGKEGSGGEGTKRRAFG
jgi:hypothetical protein